MCGTILEPNNSLNFGDAIDAAVGAKVTEEIDNIFNNGEDIKINSKDVVKKNDTKAFYSTNGESATFFSEEYNRLNSIKSKTETLDMPNEEKKEELKVEEKKEEKPKKIKEKKGEKKEKFSLKKLLNKDKENQEEIETLNLQSAEIDTLEETQPDVLFEPTKKEEKKEEEPKPVTEKAVQKVEQKREPKIKSKKEKTETMQTGKFFSFANKETIEEDEYNYQARPAQKKKTFKFNFRVIFNLCCVIFFLGALYWVYQKFSHPNNGNVISMGGLSYQISNNFKLSSNSENSKFYTYGDNCQLRVTYGDTNNEDSFIDNYFANQEQNFKNDPNNHSVREQLKINNNTWQSLRIVSLEESPAASQGLIEITKYKYIAVTHNSNYYFAIFVNLNDDNTCTAMYNDFLETLNFE